HRDLLAAGSSDSSVYLFDCASGDPVATLTGHKSAVGSVAVSLDGRYVVSGSRDGAVKLWDIDYELEIPNRIPIQSSAINCVRFSPDGRLLAIASGDWLTSGAGTIVLWDLRGGMTKQQFDVASPVGAVAFGAGQLITAEWNGRTTTWDLRSGAVNASATISKDTVSAASFAADAQSMLLAAAGEENL
ncbi:MAG TPA: cytochrome D1 domain-containing protein, partial [Pirellulaceae bacterium]|nr:cytochrome D1 domain-containing protein [Pirellulaceae bacterium]